MRALRASLILLLLLLVSVGGAGLWWLNQPLELSADPVEVSIELGTPPREIAQQ